MKKTFIVNGMHCKSCEALLVNVLSEIAGVSSVSADSKKGQVNLEYKDEKTLDAVKKAIENEEYKLI